MSITTICAVRERAQGTWFLGQSEMTDTRQQLMFEDMSPEDQERSRISLSVMPTRRLRTSCSAGGRNSISMRCAPARGVGSGGRWRTCIDREYNEKLKTQ